MNQTGTRQIYWNCLVRESHCSLQAIQISLQPTTISLNTCFGMGNKGTYKLSRFGQKMEPGGHPVHTARKSTSSLVCHGSSSRVLQGFHGREDETFRFVKCKFTSSMTGTSGTMARFLWEKETGTSPVPHFKRIQRGVEQIVCCKQTRKLLWDSIAALCFLLFLSECS